MFFFTTRHYGTLLLKIEIVVSQSSGGVEMTTGCFPPRNGIAESLELFLKRLEQFSRLHIKFLIKKTMIHGRIRDGNVADFEFLFGFSKKYMFSKT